MTDYSSLDKPTLINLLEERDRRIDEAIIELKDYKDNSDRCFCNVIAILEGKGGTAALSDESAGGKGCS